MESIREIAQKIKSFLAFPPIDMLIVTIIILVGIAGFGLGRLSAQSTQKTPVTIVDTASQMASVGDVEVLSKGNGGDVVVSKNGAKYHFPWCSGAQRIAEKNLITFTSIEEAKKAGFSPAANCKGLE
jgi:hypothetical protein